MGAPTTTFDLLERARSGDESALSSLFDSYRRRVGVLVYFKLAPELRNEADIEDIVQGTFLRAYRDLDRFQYREAGSFFRWLAAIADHVIIDRARHASRERRAGQDVRLRSESNPAGPEPAVTTTPSRLFARREEMERLLESLARLPEDYRSVILMAKVEGVPVDEIAVRLGRPRSAIAVLLYRAVRRLREIHRGAPA